MLSGERGCRPFPRTPFSACGRSPPLRSGWFLLTKSNTSRKIKRPASLRSDRVRLQPGTLFGFPSEERSPSTESAIGYTLIARTAGPLTQSRSAKAAAAVAPHPPPSSHRFLTFGHIHNRRIDDGIRGQTRGLQPEQILRQPVRTAAFGLMREPKRRLTFAAGHIAPALMVVPPVYAFLDETLGPVKWK